MPAGSNGVQHFHSRPDLEPASITINRRSSSAYGGDIFLTPQYGPVQNGPMLLDPSGNLIWFQPLPANQLATDFRVQQLNGQPVLTWWQGYTNNGSGRGEGVIYNSSYQQIATVQAGNGLQGMDLHEFLVTPQGDAYVVGVSPIHWNGMKRPLMDAVVQEIDIKTGLVLFEWHAIDHIPISASFFKNGAPGAVFDPYHLNSIALDTDGNLIVSLRNTWAVYKIDHQTGAVIWTLGSNQNNFKMGAGTQTAFQHDVVLQPNGMLTMFDDGAGPPRVHTQSRAIEESLNESNNTVTLVRQFEHSPGLSANFEGGAQVLPGGDLFVGWGQQPYFSEFNSSGQLIFDARFTSNTSSYRAYKFAWSGQPTTPPAARRGPQQRRHHPGVAELERRHRGLVVAGAGGVELEHAGAAPDRSQGRVRDGDLRAHRDGGVRGPGAGLQGQRAVDVADGDGRAPHRDRRPRCVRVRQRHRRPAGRVRQRLHLPHRGDDHRRAHL